MAKNVTEELSEFVLSHRNMTSCKDVAELYLKEHPECKISLQCITRLVYTEMNAAEENPSRPKDDIRVKLVDKDSVDTYVVDGDKYQWTSTKLGNMELPVKFADDIFYEYSKHGLNMSQDEVRRKHRLSIQAWNSIKSTLGLYKSSNIYSPYTVESCTEEELSDKIKAKLEMKGNDEYRIIEREYTNQTIKEYKKTIKKSKQKTFTENEFIDNLFSLLPKRKPLYIRETPVKKEDPNEIYAMVTDIHIGAKTEGLLTTPNYDRDVIETRLDAVALEINSKNAANVRLCILGDIIESFTGTNHINSYQSMDGSFFAELYFQAYDILDNFFSKIHNLKTINIIGGNHDRAVPDHTLDQFGTIAEILAGSFKRMYSSVYEVNFSNLVMSKQFGKSNIIMAHGDKKILKTEMFQASVRQFCVQGAMNYVFTGHLHSRNVKLDKGDMRWYQVPAIFSGNWYSEVNGWNALPGFYLLEERNGQVIVMDYPLPIEKECDECEKEIL